MAFGVAGAAAGAGDALMQMLAERRAQFVAEQAIRQRDEALAQEQAQLGATMGLQNQRLAQDQQQFDTNLDLQNRRLTQDQQHFDAGQQQFADQMAFRRNQAGVEDMERQGSMMRQQRLDDAALRERQEAPQRAIDLENLRHKNDMAEIGARGAQDRQTAASRPVAGPNASAASTSSPYAQERATRTVAAVDSLKAKVNRWTAGAGSLLKAIPETDARNFAAELNTLKANVAFNELTAMREASKTGGALGAVSDKEMLLLESALGALDQGQSPENLVAQLEQIKSSIQRWQQAQAQQAQTPSQPGDTVNINGGGALAPVKYIRDAQGRLVRQ